MLLPLTKKSMSILYPSFTHPQLFRNLFLQHNSATSASSVHLHLSQHPVFYRPPPRTQPQQPPDWATSLNVDSHPPVSLRSPYPLESHSWGLAAASSSPYPSLARSLCCSYYSCSQHSSHFQDLPPQAFPFPSQERVELEPDVSSRFL